MLKETKENEELKSIETVTKFIKDEVEDCINGFYFIVDVDVDDDDDGDGGGDRYWTTIKWILIVENGGLWDIKKE